MYNQRRRHLGVGAAARQTTRSMAGVDGEQIMAVTDYYVPSTRRQWRDWHATLQDVGAALEDVELRIDAAQHVPDALWDLVENLRAAKRSLNEQIEKLESAESRARGAQRALREAQ